MSKQIGFASAFADARLGSNKKLEEIDRQIDWSVLEPLAQRVRPGTAGRPPYEALAMLKALYLQRLYDLSDPGLEDAQGLVLRAGTMMDASIIRAQRQPPPMAAGRGAINPQEPDAGWT